MDTTNHTQINVTVCPRFEGISPVRSSGLQFTAEHNLKLSNSGNLYAKRIFLADMVVSGSNRQFSIEQSGDEVRVNNILALGVNPAGEALTSLEDPDLIYISTPVNLSIGAVDEDERVQMLITYLTAGSVWLVTSVIEQVGREPFGGLFLTAVAADIAAYEAAGNTFYIDFIYSSRTPL